MFEHFLVVFIYFLPVIMAFKRNMQERWALAIISTLLAWTGFGWFFCMLWSLFGEVERA